MKNSHCGANVNPSPGHPQRPEGAQLGSGEMWGVELFRG